MIRHRPFGRGHAYRLEPDQRVPARPAAGEPIELRATTDAGVDRLEVELSTDGVRRDEPLDLIVYGTLASGLGAAAKRAPSHDLSTRHDRREIMRRLWLPAL